MLTNPAALLLGIPWGSTLQSSPQSHPSRMTAANASLISSPGGTVGCLWNLCSEQGNQTHQATPRDQAQPQPGHSTQGLGTKTQLPTTPFPGKQDLPDSSDQRADCSNNHSFRSSWNQHCQLPDPAASLRTRIGLNMGGRQTQANSEPNEVRCPRDFQSHSYSTDQDNSQDRQTRISTPCQHDHLQVLQLLFESGYVARWADSDGRHRTNSTAFQASSSSTDRAMARRCTDADKVIVS
jgi:hypothetical protein